MTSYKGSRFGKSLLKMFDSITSDKKSNSAAQANMLAADLEASQESLRSNEILTLCKSSRHGFPFKPSCMAYDLVQNLLAIGTKNGYVRLYGASTVEYTMFHVSSLMNIGNIPSSVNSSVQCGSPLCGNTNNGGGFSPAVLFMSFLSNEGALITYCDDNTLSFWNIRQKQPALVFSKKLINERVSAMSLPFQSSWIYIGTEKGNTYVLNVYNNFSQSGYDIKWNNVIELSQKTKPGKVIHLSDHPLDNSKLMIGFDSGLIVLWNVRARKGEMRFYGTSETMSSISWFHDGKQFMSSHNNGSLIVWNCKPNTKPVTILHPHMSENDFIPQYNMIRKIEWTERSNGDQLILFSDGLPASGCSMRDAITVIKNNKLKTIIEMKDKIIDFFLVDSSPWTSENPPDPSAVIVLLETNLVVIDLRTEGYPQFDHHHPISLHESPVSMCQYIVEPNPAFYRNLNELKAKENQLKQTTTQKIQTELVPGATASEPFYSKEPYPINGGIKCPKANIFPYYELIVTGHEDGSVKVWNSSGLGLSLMTKFKTQKLFDRRKDIPEEFQVSRPFKIVAMNAWKNMIAVGALGGHVTLYKFYSRDFSDVELGDVPLLEVPVYEANEATRTNDDSDNQSAMSKREMNNILRTKVGFRRHAGFQPELVCLLMWAQKTPVINSVLISFKNNMLLIGTDESIICVDYQSRSILLNIPIPELYSNLDVFQRGFGGATGSNNNNTSGGGGASGAGLQTSPKKSTVNKANSSANEDDTQEKSNTEIHVTRQFTLDNASRSSSNSSLENMAATEGVSLIAINENSCNNNDPSSRLSQVWIGTNYGSAYVLNAISSCCPDSQGNAEKEPLPKDKTTSISPTGIQIKLKGKIIDINFLDLNGILLTPNNSNNNQYITQGGKSGIDTGLEDLDLDLDLNTYSNSIADNFFGGGNGGGSISSSNSQAQDTASGSSASPSVTPTGNSNFVNPFSSQVSQEESSRDSKSKSNKKSLTMIKNKWDEVNNMADRNLFAVITSEHQIKVVALPNLVTVHKYTINEGTVAKASIAVLNTLSYLTCCLTNGTYLVFNLPNLKLNVQLSLTPLTHDKNFVDRVLKTFTFGSKGHSFYMSSPYEMQKLYLSSSSNVFNLSDMLPELFDPKIITPERPKTNIFKTIFSNTSQAQLDREELFGEASGKPSVQIVKNVESEVNKARGELSELQKLALERGEKLSALSMKSEALTEAASQYAKNAQALAAKYKKKSEWF